MFDYRFNGLPNMLTAQMPFMPQNMLSPVAQQSQQIDPTATAAIPQQMPQAPAQVPQGDMNYFPPQPDANAAPITPQDYQASLSLLQPQSAPQQPQQPAQAGSGAPGGMDMGTVAAFLQGLGRGNGVLSAIGGGMGAVQERKQENQTIKYLTSRGIPEGEAQLLAQSPQATFQVLQNMRKGGDPKAMLELQKLGYETEKARRDATAPIKPNLINVGDGNIYNADSQSWMTAPNGGMKKPSAVQEYEYAKGQGFPGTFQDWEASKKGGMSLQVDPETGAISFQQGGNIKPMTEGQSKDTTYATRAAGALPILDQYGPSLTSITERVGGNVPVAGNYIKSPEYQQAEQAGLEFLQAILRKDTGAAITKEETQEYGKVYLPQPGDSPALLAQKQVARSRALNALEAGMTPQSMLAKERALKKTDATQPPQSGVQAGQVEDGYRFKGGDPANPQNWEKVN